MSDNDGLKWYIGSLVFFILVFFLLFKLHTYLFGDYVGTDITEKLVKSTVVSVAVGESFPLDDVLSKYDGVTDYLYQGVTKESDEGTQLQIGKRLYHGGSGSKNTSYEIQEMLVNAKIGEKITQINTKEEDDEFYYDVTLLKVTDNAIEVRLDKNQVTKTMIREGEHLKEWVQKAERENQ